jgi:mono/diheme cytochrome c family protein
MSGSARRLRSMFALLLLAASSTSLLRAAAPGMTLRPSSIALPDETPALPPGPGAELVEANCSLCHSLNMLTVQPPQQAAQWRAIVEKMRNVYNAPVQEADVPTITAYLTAMSARSARDAERRSR